MITAHSMLEAIEIAKAGGECMVRCVAHDDGQASLHVKAGETHPVIMMCHAGCTTEQILEAAGIEYSSILAERDETGVTQDVWTPVFEAGQRRAPSHIYKYLDEEGSLLYEVLRIPLSGGKKTFRQRTPDMSGPHGWRWNMDGTRRVLYRLPELLQAKEQGRVIYVVEGEKDVESLRKIGQVATTSPMGAGKWQEDYAESLAGSTVVVIPDTDATGRAHARTVRLSLIAHGCTVSIKEPANGAKDVTEHLEAGGTLDTLVETVPEQETEKVSYGLDILDAVKREIKPNSFVIPGVLARGERWLLTGFEGHGKSTMLRQLAIQIAAGIHPWTYMDMPSQKVLFIDVENHPDQVMEGWRDMLGLAARHDHPIGKGRLILLEEWDNELDLCSEEGEAWFLERIHAEKPDVICMGPLYNMSAKDLSEHSVVGRLKQVINKGRSLYGSAVIMEHHAPHKGPMDSKRSVRPYGSSTFLKWPDFGLGLKPNVVEGRDDVYEFEKFRFNRVRQREFPLHMRWGTPHSLEWPWVPCQVTEEGEVY